MKTLSSSSTPIETSLEKGEKALKRWFSKGSLLLDLENYPLKKLAKEVSLISDALIRGTFVDYLKKEYLKAYFSFYFPQGFLRTYIVLHEMKSRLSMEWNGIKINDFGTGPGASLLAAMEVFKESEIVGIERVKHNAEFARDLSGLEILKEDFTKSKIRGDIAIFSSSLSEVKNYKKIIKRIWQTHRCLVIIEPGWQKGYRMIMELSNFFDPPILPCGGFRCQLGKGDWCHMSLPFKPPEITLKINSLLRHKLKYLKFTYGVFCKEARTKSWGIRLRSPLIKEKGKVYYLACDAGKSLRLEILGKRKIPQAFCGEFVEVSGKKIKDGLIRVDEINRLAF